MEDARAMMIKLAEQMGDVAAQLLAEKATEVHMRTPWNDYAMTIELEDVEVQLAWCPFDGWDGPSTTADTLAKLVYEERRRIARMRNQQEG